MSRELSTPFFRFSNPSSITVLSSRCFLQMRILYCIFAKSKPFSKILWGPDWIKSCEKKQYNKSQDIFLLHNKANINFFFGSGSELVKVLFGSGSKLIIFATLRPSWEDANMIFNINLKGAGIVLGILNTTY